MSAISPKLIIATLFVILFLWASYKILRKRLADIQYGAMVSGGRSGTIRFRLSEGLARANYEVGLKGLIIYKSSLSWDNGSNFSQQEYLQAISTLNSWSHARGSLFEIADDA